MGVTIERTEEVKTHTIKFRELTSLNVAPPQGSESVRTKVMKVKKGTCFSGTTLKPYVEDLIEKCDIGLANGCEALGVEYSKFQFLDADFEDAQ